MILPDEYDAEDDANSEFYFKMQFGDFFNRMSNHFFILAVKVSEITNMFLENSIKSKEKRTENLTKALDEMQGLTDRDKEKLIKISVEEDAFFTSSNGTLH